MGTCVSECLGMFVRLQTSHWDACQVKLSEYGADHALPQKNVQNSYTFDKNVNSFLKSCQLEVCAISHENPTSCIKPTKET